MDKSKTILVVDDDTELCELLAQFLQQHQYQVLCVHTGSAALKALKEKRIDLVLLDVMLACEDGLEVCKSIRQHSNVPVIMLTGLKSDSEKILGLEYGADDYITKPFNNRELLARIRAVIRRVYPEKDNEPIYQFSGFTLITQSRELLDSKQQPIDITTGLYELLLVFVENAHRILSRDQLMDSLHGRAANSYDRSIDIQLSRLRAKLNDKDGKLIKTVRNKGYMLVAEVNVLKG